MLWIVRLVLNKRDTLDFPSCVCSHGHRIQPLHLFVMCLTIGLISVVHWGPYWFPFMDTMMDCKTYWWANLLLISNLLPVHEIVSSKNNLMAQVVFYIIHEAFISQCIPWTWYLSLDFQCYATTPLLVYFYRLYVMFIYTCTNFLYESWPQFTTTSLTYSFCLLFSQKQRCVFDGCWSPSADDHCGQRRYNCTPAAAGLSAIYTVR